MAEIINLKRAKKAKARRAEDAKAMDNRVRFGTPKAEKSLVCPVSPIGCGGRSSMINVSA